MSNLTFILADVTDACPTVTYVLRDNVSGEVYLSHIEGDTRDHESDRNTWDAHNVSVLTVIEGEYNPATGEASAWVRF